MTTCPCCDKVLATRDQIKFCSNICQKEYLHFNYIKKWKEVEINKQLPLSKNISKNISKHIRRYIQEKFDYKCSSCGWNKINPITNKVPLEIDHIDGNYENNIETNLRPLCPNCHSLTSSFRNLNKGKGRAWRKKKHD